MFALGAGTCHIWATTSLWMRLIGDPRLSSSVLVRRAVAFGPPDLWLLYVESPLLPSGYCYFRELVVDAQTLRFKPFRSTGYDND